MPVNSAIPGNNSLLYFRPAKIVYASSIGTLSSSARNAWKTLRAWMTANGLKIEEVALGFGLLHNNGSHTACRFDACIDIAYQGKPADNQLPIKTLAGGVYIASNPLNSHADLNDASYSVERDPLVGQALTIDDQRPAIVTYKQDSTSAWKLTLNRPVSLSEHRAA